ncbi:MAG TPA: T9SS type A sorting domain-containing protein [Paludibacteraceae bacterium]|nr:T9SS type A sorting domain-containing protein [Paludibacteraceae bacterium]HQF49765.1 T9SS type A sorting domain-containing protein [Paludibacteraceae bacterium]HQJ89917.1 T9SS type A sorting domain-containing protein [Paludibacteraceae bacterium]
MIKRFLSFMAASYAAIFMSYAGEVPLVYSVENTGAEFEDPVMPSASQLPTVSKLPNPFEWSDGSGKITSFCEWSKRRNEIKREIEHYEIGEKPTFEKLTATYSNGTLTVVITNSGRSLTLTSKLSVPSGSGPHPIVIGMDGNTGSLASSYFSKCIQVPFTHSQISEYSSGFGGGAKSQNDPFFKLYPNDFAKGDYCTWSWGISRLIDGLEIVKDQINADLSHLAVTGCSYAGKMALFAGAFDERVALTIAQESGGGGVNSWRVSEKIGSSVEGISNTNYDWFMQSFKNDFNGKTSKIPYDHHELIAMIAPRAFLAFGNPNYEWLGDESGYISCQAAFEVWKAMGIEDRYGFVFEGGHEHCQASSKQNDAAQKFITRFLYGDESVNTNIRTSTVNADYASWSSEWSGYQLDMDNTDCGNGGEQKPDPIFTFDEPKQTSKWCDDSTHTISWSMEGETESTYSLIWDTGSADRKVTVSKATASSEWTDGTTSWNVENILTDDGNNGETSRWAAADGKTNGSWVEFTLSKKQVVAGVKIDEFVKYGNITEFEIQYDKDGVWATAYKGTTAGENFSATFDPVSTDKLRLSITKVKDDLNINYVSFTGIANVELKKDIQGSGSYEWNVPEGFLSAGTFTINKSASKSLAASPEISIVNCNEGTSVNELSISGTSLVITPNPVTDGMAQISLNLPSATFISIKLYNTLGVEVMDVASCMMDEGTNNIELSTKELASGIYYCVVRSDDSVNKQTIFIR